MKELFSQVKAYKTLQQIVYFFSFHFFSIHIQWHSSCECLCVCVCMSLTTTELLREKTNNLGSDHVGHNPACTVTESG